MKQKHNCIAVFRVGSFQSFLIPNFFNSLSFDFFQTPLRTPETMPAEPPRKRSTFVSSSATVENVSQPSPDWRTIWTLNGFARPSKRISAATVPSKRMRMRGKSFSYRVTSEQTSKPFWWIKKSVTENPLSCTVSKSIHRFGNMIVFVCVLSCVKKNPMHKK